MCNPFRARAQRLWERPRPPKFPILRHGARPGRLGALTRAERLEPLEARICASLAVERMELPESAGIAPTSTIFRADSAAVCSYRPPPELQALLEKG